VLRQPVLAWIGIEPASGGGCSAGGHEFHSPLLFIASAKQSIEP
jgi:hypothetical protein